MNEIVLPRLGWSMEEGIFRGWLKRDGDAVQAGEPLFSVEGDKAVQDVEALDSGTLRIAASGPQDGDTIAVGTVLGHLETTGEPSRTRAVGPPSRGGPPQREASRDIPKASSHEGAARLAAPTSTPRARRTAQQRGIDISQVTGTGRNGRIRERDILAHTASPSPLRQTIARRMTHSLHTTAPVTLTTTADATALVALREQLKPTIAPTFTDLFLKLTAAALSQHPALNARWENDRVVPQPGIHIGFAVDTDAGLLVPVVRDVPQLSLADLAAKTRALTAAAHARTLTPADLQGGTFTITNLGAYGIDAFTPIINWPECAILGVGAIRAQPVVVERQVVIREVVSLSLTFDHRIVDGAPAARFLKALRTGIQNPSGWLHG